MTVLNENEKSRCRRLHIGLASEPFTAEHAAERRKHGRFGAYSVEHAATTRSGERRPIADVVFDAHTTIGHHSRSVLHDELRQRHGRENIHEVYQDPRKHVR